MFLARIAKQDVHPDVARTAFLSFNRRRVSIFTPLGIDGGDKNDGNVKRPQIR